MLIRKDQKKRDMLQLLKNPKISPNEKWAKLQLNKQYLSDGDFRKWDIHLRNK